MDAETRHKLLFDKIAANSQRRQRDKLLTRLPRTLSDVFGACVCIYSPDLDSVLRRFLPFNHIGIGLDGFVPQHYQYAEVAQECKVFASLSRLVVPLVAGNAFLLTKSPSPVLFGSQELWRPDVPIFFVDFRWAAEHLKEIWSYCTGQLFLVEEDLQAGFLIDNYVGYLAEDSSPKELVYEVGLWPACAQDAGAE